MFVNQKTQELNFKVAFIDADGASAHAVVKHLHSQAHEQTPLTVTDIQGFEVILFSYVPPNLGRIKDFAIRLHVFGARSEDATDLLDPIVAGANALVWVAEDVPALQSMRSRIDDAVTRVYGGTWRPPHVAFLTKAAEGASPTEGFNATVSDATSLDEGATNALKAALKACVMRMKEGDEAPKSDVPLRPVVAINMADVLRRLEKSKGAALTEEDVLAVRDNAPFVMLPQEKADEFVAQWQGDYINPAAPWNAWQALKASQET